MQFRVYLGHKNGVPIPKNTIPKGKSHFGQLLAGSVEGRCIARLIDKDMDLIAPLYDPIVLRVTETYMELGGVAADGLPQTWVLRFFPIEATAEWAREYAKISTAPSLNGTMAHLQTLPIHKRPKE
jgi:hypothetical protein